MFSVFTIEINILVGTSTLSLYCAAPEGESKLKILGRHCIESLVDIAKQTGCKQLFF